MSFCCRLGKILAALFIIPPLSYLAIALLLGNISQQGTDDSDSDIAIYLLSNGIHTDLALPLYNDIFDWATIIDPNDTAAGRENINYVAFGWGDRGFYVETPRWSDLKISTALKALSGIGDSVIHATYYSELYVSANSILIHMNRDQYQKLSQSILSSFQLNHGRAIPILRSYGSHDAFYAAQGSYSLIKTCNSWINQRLQDAGLKHVIWTPFANSLVRLYRQP
ncbi:MAG: TIGR02117 family protein [Cardiobacteriaceae bacterium]|nr:TIGR02117 family protein [Cardiobacteriaceae bacterium]